MCLGEIAGAVDVAKPAHNLRGPVVSRRAIGRFVSQTFLDVAADDLGERHTPFASLCAELSRLPLCELDLGSDHGSV